MNMVFGAGFSFHQIRGPVKPSGLTARLTGPSQEINSLISVFQYLDSTIPRSDHWCRQGRQSFSHVCDLVWAPHFCEFDGDGCCTAR